MRQLITAVLIFAAVPVFGADPAQIDRLLSRYNESGTFNGAVLAPEKGEAFLKKGKD